MKRIIATLLSAYLFFMFLVYSGVFRNYANPIVVVSYYLECIKNREGFLTYQICKEESFNEDRLGEIYRKYKMNCIDNFVLKSNELKNNTANVQIKIIYKDKQEKTINLELKKDGRIWKIGKGLI